MDEIVEDEEEFYDVKSVSDTELEIEEDIRNYTDDSLSLKSQLKLFPSLTKSINKTISKILEESYEKTREYLEDYCAMQKDMVFCNEPEYIEAFKNYFKIEKDKATNRDNLVKDLSNSVSTSFFCSASSIDDLPLKRIQSESLETLTVKQEEVEEESSGFLKEFLALLFPNVQDIKRVEYRPKKRLIDKRVDASERTASTYTADTADTVKIYSNSQSADEEFLLKLLVIYLKSYKVQLKDFLPKCINYHLIQGTLKQLPIKLLNCCKVDSDGNWKDEEIRKMERVLKMIEETEEIKI